VSVPTILLVDDRVENLVALEATLAADTHRIVRATSAREALEALLREDEVALAIVDVQMPEIDGFQLAELMRGTRRTRSIPIIFVTAGQHGEERVFAGYESGAVDYLEKPLQPWVLRGKAAVFLELWRQRQQLAARVQELEAVLAAVPAAVFLMRDATVGVIEGNDYAHEILRLPPAAGIAADAPPPGFRLMDGDRELEEDERPVQLAIATGREQRGCEMDVLFPGGDRVHLYGNATPLLDGDGRVRGSVGAFVDITRLKQAEARLRDADRQKDEFLAALSHELRNPLMPISSSLHVLRRVPPGSDAARQALGVVERQVAHLTHLVGDLLDVARVSRGKMQLRPEALEIGPAVQRIVEDHREQFGAGGVEVAVRLPPEPLVCHVDRARFVQMLGNLLGNALKFTPRGGHVAVELRRDGAFASLAVRDDGVGIAPETLPQLFRPFTQGDRTLDRSLGGLGLGLSVVKSLAEMQGGTVHASSAGVGCGAEFVVRLPLSAAAAAAPARARTPEPGTVARRVLLIEDNADGAAMTATAIRLLGHEVVVLNDGAGALATVRSFRPDVVFCDLGLPGMDGYAVAAALRDDEHGRAACLVAVSGYASPRDRERALAAGFHEHVAKPADLDVLRALIERGAGAQRSADARAAS
jgi:signal transduction histidine kinase